MIEPAVANDLDDVRALLSRCELPTEGLTEQFPGGYVVARRGGAIVGAAGLEVHGTAGVLRSVAVDPRERGTGLGVRLTQDRLAAAGALALEAVYLLTTTAAAFYPRFGFAPFPRASAACLWLRPSATKPVSQT